MDSIEYFFDAINAILNTKKKKHVVGGLLLSASFFFCGLAVTAITLKEDK